jgi:homoserine O-acetyltransferase
MSLTTLQSNVDEVVDIGEFVTQGGETLSPCLLRYRIFGDPAVARRKGWILVFHALTGSPDVDQWWGPLLGHGLALDSSNHPVLATNLIGSCYGSTAPRPGNPFPRLTPRDLARVHGPLLAQLAVDRISLATGGSLGGMVALEWAQNATVPTDRVVVFAAPSSTSAQSIAWNAAQRMAIESDQRWSGGGYPPEAPPIDGLAAARAIAMITYRSADEFAQRFSRNSTRDPHRFDAEHYLRRHGEKLAARFDPLSYHTLTEVMDRHDLGDIVTAAREIEQRVGSLVGVGIDSDILYPAAEVWNWVRDLGNLGVPTKYREITSLYGHDAFLIELDQVGAILREEA